MQKLAKISLSVLHSIAKWGAGLGLKRVGSLGCCIGTAMWYVLPSRRRYTINCVAERLQVPHDEAKRIAYESFQHNGRSFAELVCAPYFGFELAKDKLEIVNPSNLEALLTSNRPVVAFTGHIGAWELCAGLLGDFPKDLPRMVVVRRNKSEILNQFIADIRGARGVSIADHRKAAFSVLRLLKRNGIVAFLIDHNTSASEAVFLPFLGKTAAVNMGPALLALRGNALVWPLFLVRKGDKFIVYTEEPLDTTQLEGDRTEKIEAICAFYTQVMERVVRAYPEQWFWMHHRWKTKPHANLVTNAPNVNQIKTTENTKQ